MTSNLISFIFSIVPALVYTFIIFLSVPYKSLSTRKTFVYLFTGVFSMFVFYSAHWIFPIIKPTQGNPLLISIISVFLNVAFLEEFCKFTAFNTTTNLIYEDSNKDLPIATMFYTCMTSTSFAIIENMTYAAQYGADLLWTRSFTSVILHMICGLIMGYFIALSRMDTKLKNNSYFSLFMKKNTSLKRFVYTGIGIAFSTIMHGLYNYNIIYNHTSSVYLNLVSTLFIGLFIAYMMGSHLISLKNKVTS